MDTYQLKKVLSRDLGSSFGGVYPRDLIPDHLNFKEKAIVINTDPHDQPGTHLGLFIFRRRYGRIFRFLWISSLVL